MFTVNVSHPATLEELLGGDYSEEDKKQWEEAGRDTPSPARCKALLAAGGSCEEDVKEPYELDGRRAGSVARFINTSDKPNLFIQSVCSGHTDVRQSRICLFALEDIPALNELTYDYGKDYRTKLLGGDGEYLERLKHGSR